MMKKIPEEREKERRQYGADLEVSKWRADKTRKVQGKQPIITG